MNGQDETTGVQSPREGPDIDRVVADQWPSRAFPLDTSPRRPGSVRVVIRQSVLNEIHRHGQSRCDAEVCGVLVGRGYCNEQGPFVYVENVIRGQHADSQTGQVTFTGQTWQYIHTELDRRFPDQSIVGWYHTHPGFGIFLSAMDRFIHENYFGADEQVALVYDPTSGEEGLFVWRAGRPVRDGFLVEADAEPAGGVAAEPQEDAERADGAGELRQRLERIEHGQKLQLLATLAVAAVTAVLIAVGVSLWLLRPLPASYGRPVLVPVIPEGGGTTERDAWPPPKGQQRAAPAGTPPERETNVPAGPGRSPAAKPAGNKPAGARQRADQTRDQQQDGADKPNEGR